MSRIANAPVELPKGVEVNLSGRDLKVKGGKGELALQIHELVEIAQEDNVLKLSAAEGSKKSTAMAGTFRALVNNMVTGVSKGFEKKLQLNERVKAIIQAVKSL